MDHQVQPLSLVARLLAGLALAVTLLAASACQREDDSSAQVDPDAFTPLLASPGRFVSDEGRISVPIPSGDGWECLQEQHGRGPSAALAVRCRRVDPSELLFFAAKTHRQPPEQRVDAETLLMSLYRADNEAFFATLEYRSSGPAELAGAAGWEAELDATHERYGVVRKRERVAIVGDRVFAISAEGRPALWQEHAAAIEQWFASVEFAR
ncbi:hypothetical protein ACNOYE_34380 [Nannocystaceae bacterium ST9]